MPSVGCVWQTVIVNLNANEELLPIKVEETGLAHKATTYMNDFVGDASIIDHVSLSIDLLYVYKIILACYLILAYYWPIIMLTRTCTSTLH